MHVISRQASTQNTNPEHGSGLRDLVGHVGATRTCVRCVRLYCKTPSRDLLGGSGLYRELAGFVGNRVWALEIGCRGVLWVALYGVVPGCKGVRVSRKISTSSGESAPWEGFELSLVCRIGALAR